MRTSCKERTADDTGLEKWERTVPVPRSSVEPLYYVAVKEPLGNCGCVGPLAKMGGTTPDL